MTFIVNKNNLEKLFQDVDKPGLYPIWVKAFTEENGHSPYTKPSQPESKENNMKHIIPNPTQLNGLIEIYKLRYPTKNIAILTTGLVVHRRSKSGSKIIGQVMVIDGWLTCFVMDGTDHSIIWENLVQPAPSELELLKARVAELENRVF